MKNINKSISARLLLVAGALAITPSVQSSSLYPDPLLGQIEAVHLVVSTNGLGVSPIPGLDLKDLRSALVSSCERAMGEFGLELAAASDPYLTVSFEHAWSDSDRSMVAILIRMRVAVSATATMDELNSGPKRNVTIWEEESLVLRAVEDTQRSIQEVVAEFLSRLRDDLTSARQRSKRDGRGGAR